MKVIIAGSRSLGYNTVNKVMKDITWDITEIVSGGARGVDQGGERWAIKESIPIKQFIPDWDKFGKGAGFIRNTQMVKYADALIAIWDGKSKGTQDTINKATEKNLNVIVTILPIEK